MTEIRGNDEGFLGGKTFAIGCTCLLVFFLIFFAWEETYNPEYLDWLRYVFPQLH